MGVCPLGWFGSSYPNTVEFLDSYPFIFNLKTYYHYISFTTLVTMYRVVHCI